MLFLTNPECDFRFHVKHFQTKLTLQLSWSVVQYVCGASPGKQNAFDRQNKILKTVISNIAIVYVVTLQTSSKTNVNKFCLQNGSYTSSGLTAHAHSFLTASQFGYVTGATKTRNPGLKIGWYLMGPFTEFQHLVLG